VKLINRSMSTIHVETDGLDPERCDVTRATVCDVDGGEIGELGTELLLCNNAPWTLAVLGYPVFEPCVLDVSVLDQIAQGARPRARTWHAMCTAHGVRSTDPLPGDPVRTARRGGAPHGAHRAVEHPCRGLQGTHEADGVRISWPI
jgi:hypothetical protein